ncbi:hypothetical protein SAMN04488066_11333 [Halorubrum aquaticum]|uniref:Uncharacterized protein n=1 Tax=Halorubrum aquaticum TaxID=387340 RepID=A0A1I3BL95_9EURY|nr:hypothetical protein [Halorubrum aquaticum]SFH62699.1 hypothetical protein SAMN04488066_11333 [Halorubrum aquaticum]
MRRRALLAVAATVPLAGCPTPPWGETPENVDGAEVRVRREHTGAFDPAEPEYRDAAVLLRTLDADPSRLTVRGQLLAGARECYRVDLVEADLTESRLLIRLTTEDDPDWEGGACHDVGEAHPYEVEVAFTEAPVPDRVEVRHDDETVLEETVTTD